MGVTLQYPHSRILTPGSMGVEVYQPRGAAAAAADWWDPNSEGLCIWAAYQPKGSADFATSLTDLSGNGNNAGDPGGVNTPAWDATNGWKFDGVNDYLTTGFMPQNDQSQSMIIQYTNVTTQNQAAGVRSDGLNTDYFILRPNRAGANVFYRNGNPGVGVAPALLAGNIAIAGNQGYRNGAAEGAALGAWGGASSTTDVYIGCYNNRGTGTLGHEAYYCQAFALYDCTLTSGQVSAIATAMAAL